MSKRTTGELAGQDARVSRMYQIFNIGMYKASQNHRNIFQWHKLRTKLRRSEGSKKCRNIRDFNVEV